MKEINSGGQLTAEESSYANKTEFGKDYQTKESLLRNYLSKNYFKLSLLGFLINFVYEKGYKNILSLGAGTCVLEYLLMQ